MDLVCSNCGEVWFKEYVLHAAPEDFTRKGDVITHCPRCPKDESEPRLDEIRN